jgi:hypothetical protein
MPNDEFPKIDPKEAIKARKIFLEDLTDDIGTEKEDRKAKATPQQQPKREKERIALILEQPQHMAIENAEMKILTTIGEVNLPVYLGDRQLLPGEVVILDDDNMVPHKAEFVSVEETINKGDGVFLVKVRLPRQS